MKLHDKNEIRDLRNGDWYWIPKSVIRHYARKVGAIGIAVYNFLASLADGSQRCFPSQKYIADCLGYSRPYISRTLKLLERNGLIKVEKRSRYHCVYYLLKPRCKLEETQMLTGGNPEFTRVNTNNNKLTRNINNIIEEKNFLNSNAFKGFRPKTREEVLALDLAKALNDRRNLALYLSYAKKYPESFLRGVLGEVKEIPYERIRKSRAALFNHLVQKYAQKASKDPGH
jgi:DNA-binding MarR family transcriptional regulator